MAWQSGGAESRTSVESKACSGNMTKLDSLAFCLIRAELAERASAFPDMSSSLTRFARKKVARG